MLFGPSVCQVCSELDDERRKHAQDTAQGDDVTYMLEKERGRLRQEVIVWHFPTGQHSSVNIAINTILHKSCVILGRSRLAYSDKIIAAK